MPQKPFSPEQISSKLREAEVQYRPTGLLASVYLPGLNFGKVGIFVFLIPTLLVFILAVPARLMPDN